MTSTDVKPPAAPPATVCTWPVDFAHVAFLVASAALLIAHRGEVPGAGAWLALNAALVAGLLAIRRLARRRSDAWGAHARLVGTIVTIPIVFTQLGSLVPYVNPRRYERALFDLDLLVCGGVNPLEALERVAHPWLTEGLQWVYDFYYFIPVILGVAVVRRGQTIDLARMLFVMTLCIYVSYVGYYLVPAAGPNINHLGLYRFGSELRGVFMARELRETLAAIEQIKQDCFPSGHTAVSIAALLLAYRFARDTVALLWPLVLALVFSTLYLRYHYVADVLAGIALAFAADWIGVRWHRACEIQRARGPIHA
jgi:membrane-associated phospholipid phosphatase